MGDEWERLGIALLDWPDDVDTLLRRYVADHASELDEFHAR
jgi:hypothetical protein